MRKIMTNVKRTKGKINYEKKNTKSEKNIKRTKTKVKKIQMKF